MSAVLRKEWLKNACLKFPGQTIDNMKNQVLFQAQLLRPDWNKLTCTISDGFHMIDAVLDQNAILKFESEFQRSKPALNGSLITCMKAMFEVPATLNKFVMFIDDFDYIGDNSHQHKNPSDLNDDPQVKEFLAIYCRDGDIGLIPRDQEALLENVKPLTSDSGQEGFSIGVGYTVDDEEGLVLEDICPSDSSSVAHSKPNPAAAHGDPAQLPVVAPTATAGPVQVPESQPSWVESQASAAASAAPSPNRQPRTLRPCTNLAQDNHLPSHPTTPPIAPARRDASSSQPSPPVSQPSDANACGEHTQTVETAATLTSAAAASALLSLSDSPRRDPALDWYAQQLMTQALDLPPSDSDTDPFISAVAVGKDLGVEEESMVLAVEQPFCSRASRRWKAAAGAGEEPRGMAGDGGPPAPPRGPRSGSGNDVLAGESLARAGPAGGLGDASEWQRGMDSGSLRGLLAAMAAERRHYSPEARRRRSRLSLQQELMAAMRGEAADGCCG